MMWSDFGNVPFMRLGIQWWIAPFILLELVLKAMALWRAARNNNKAWYIALLILNTAGILPAIYLLTAKKK